MRIISKEMRMQAVLQALQSLQHYPGNITKGLLLSNDCEHEKEFRFYCFYF